MVGSAQKEVISLSHKYFYVIEQKKKSQTETKSWNLKKKKNLQSEKIFLSSSVKKFS